jgi:hypothetical protein
MFFSINYSKGGTNVMALKGKNFHVDLICVWKGKGPKLFTPIASNKNLEAMTRATKA